MIARSLQYSENQTLVTVLIDVRIQVEVPKYDRSREPAHMNADALSYHPLPIQPFVKQLPTEIVLLVDHLDNSPVTAHQIKECTQSDPQLAQACPIFREESRALNLRRLSIVGY